MGIKDVTEKFKSGWNAVTAVAAVVISVIAKMVADPPTLWRDAGQQPVFIFFVATVIVAVGVSSATAGKEPEHRTRLGWMVGLVVAVAVAYFIMSAQLSCPFAGERMAAGWAYLPAATEYVAKNPQLNCSLLIADFTGNTDSIWPRNQILGTWLLLFTTYILAVTLAAAAVVRIMQNLTGR
ncbi:hypothetical protein [Mesorhizobium sp. LSJC264A00]|uniref:hypothetical protein n=1 Tax=unclassified Mesorhizobium TaxID=325217 RepID=UPI0003CE30B6|nr:hypothetical protein [Mesorhizobium sp. LSJC264A00]ESX22564.1 hypothetical protein X767_18040 [Mesorhizobium sp. LSJC264A00]